MARYDDLNTKMIAYWAVLSIIILVLLLNCSRHFASTWSLGPSKDQDAWARN